MPISHSGRCVVASLSAATAAPASVTAISTISAMRCRLGARGGECSRCSRPYPFVTAAMRATLPTTSGLCDRWRTAVLVGLFSFLHAPDDHDDPADDRNDADQL